MNDPSVDPPLCPLLTRLLALASEIDENKKTLPKKARQDQRRSEGDTTTLKPN